MTEIYPNGIRPENQLFHSLMIKLDQECIRADQAEANEELYHLAFLFLNEQGWFQNHRHELTAHMDKILERKRKRYQITNSDV